MFLENCRSESDSLDAFFGRNQSPASWIYLSNQNYFFLTVVKVMESNGKDERRTLFLSTVDQLLSLPKGDFVKVLEANLVFTKISTIQRDWSLKKIKRILKISGTNQNGFAFEMDGNTFIDEAGNNLIKIDQNFNILTEYI